MNFSCPAGAELASISGNQFKSAVSVLSFLALGKAVTKRPWVVTNGLEVVTKRPKVVTKCPQVVTKWPQVVTNGGQVVTSYERELQCFQRSRPIERPETSKKAENIFLVVLRVVIVAIKSANRAFSAITL